jgi:hypothetical protein
MFNVKNIFWERFNIYYDVAKLIKGIMKLESILLINRKVASFKIKQYEYFKGT